jgi:hypothetical protein
VRARLTSSEKFCTASAVSESPLVGFSEDSGAWMTSIGLCRIELSDSPQVRAASGGISSPVRPMRPSTNSFTVSSAASNCSRVSRVPARLRTFASISVAASTAIGWQSPNPTGTLTFKLSSCAVESTQSWMAAAWLSARSSAACAAGIARIFQ